MTIEYLSLFFNGFLSATILPGTSEVLFVYLMSDGLNPWIGWLVVAVGNILGAYLSFFMGMGIRSFFFRNKPPSPNNAHSWLNRYGAVMLFWSWVPIFGDPLVIAAGAMRLPKLSCLFWIAVGKILRYGLLVLPFWLG